MGFKRIKESEKGDCRKERKGGKRVRRKVRKWGKRGKEESELGGK